jgi:hypothetical protein
VRSLRFVLALGAAGTLCAAAATIAPAMTQPPKTAKLSIIGGLTFEPGKFVRDDQRFAPRNLEVRSGGKVRLRNRANTEDPHTLSLVKRSELPDRPSEVFNCRACEPFFGAHQVNEETGDVGMPVVNVGEEGFDQAGDSIFVPPAGTVQFDISADRGKKLYYLCAVHPWMQGRLRVR